jgi:quercetin dioxygenase-like cupin family protein
MNSAYHYIANLTGEIGAIAPDSIISRTLQNSPDLKVILFGFAPGQELSEHTASRSAILYFLRGEAQLTLGGEAQRAMPGTLVTMPPRLPHSVLAETETVMLLLMLSSQ